MTSSALAGRNSLRPILGWRDPYGWLWGGVGFLLLSQSVGGQASYSAESLTFKAIAAGGQHTCGVSVGGEVFCWGSHQQGQLGLSAQQPVLRPVRVAGVGQVIGIAAEGSQTCALRATGQAVCWGSDRLPSGEVSAVHTPQPTAVPLGDPVQSISLGRHHACFLSQPPAIYCQGSNLLGQVGTIVDAGTAAAQPVAVRHLGAVVGVAAGAVHTCGLLPTGGVSCWGDFGLGSGSYQPIPMQGVVNGQGLAAGNRFTCALLRDGRVRCWGVDDFGQLGNGSLDVPGAAVFVNGIGEAQAIAAGSYHACAVVAGGAVKCWGANILGQLGDGTTQSSPIPVTVKGLPPAIALSLGEGHSCALLTDQTARCWGYNLSGQLGNGTTLNSAVPVMVEGSPSP
ncbi:MAG: biotin transporter BioY [Cyanobacteriota bacterium]|nr:biotin transporter BioY [Cyanobacteriota bacterium]